MRPTHYDIVIDGELDGSLAPAFHPHRVRSRSGTTTISGERLDQAALMGILATVTELALTLARVERIEPSAGSSA